MESRPSNRGEAAVAFVHGLDRFNGQEQQGIKRAGAVTRFPIGAMSTHVTMEPLNVRIDHSTPRGVCELDDLRQMEFDAALLAVRSARGTSRRPIDAATAHLLANLRQVFIELCLGVHFTPAFPAHWRRRMVCHFESVSKRNADR
jgi:hypothetical protein